MGFDGKEMACGDGDALQWLGCALSCSGDMQRWAAWGLEQNSFWGHFADAFDRGGRDTVGLFELIAANARPDTLHALFAYPRAGNYLASVFGAGYRAAYFEASLSDVLFGTDLVDQVSAADLAGATPWQAITFEVMLRAKSGQSDVSDDILRRLSSVSLNLAHATINVGRVIWFSGHNLSSYQWGRWQQVMMAGNGLHVNVSEEETSEWQALAEDILGCVTDPICLAGAVWRSKSEVEYYYP